MAKVYEEQGDGSLKPVEIPETLAKRVKIYSYLRYRHNLSLDEIRFITRDMENWD